ncbi:MAG TPA: hypothetical protein VF275_03295 [Gammaproteobacteria bacterium]
MDGKSTDRRRLDKDLVLDRDDDGRVYACLPRTIRHYGEESFDWGYIGPATAELALNVLNWILPPGVDGEKAIQCEEGECSAVAWRLHRSFMAEFLVRVPYGGGCIPESDVRRWVLQHFSVPEEAVPPLKPRSWLSSLVSN